MSSARAVIIVAAAVAACIPGTSMSQNSGNLGYLVDAAGKPNVVTSGTGLCWHTAEWTPARGVQRCDPVSLESGPALVPTQRAVTQPAAQPVAAVTPLPPQSSSAPESTPPVRLQVAEIAALTQTMQLSADTFFDFDQSLLKPKGKMILDDMVRTLAGAHYETISVIGYTDRIGGTEYNQRLSERRATAVKDYLVSQNIFADHIEAQGRGDTQPTTKSGDCKGPTSAKVIACLQPDRRVDITVSGTKPLKSASR